MRDYITIGSVPFGEDCAQVGQPDYHRLASVECKAFIGQLRRMFGPEPEGARLAVKAFPHDFGTYHEVVCHFYTDNQDSLSYALKCEGEGPENWDSEAKQAIQAVYWLHGE